MLVTVATAVMVFFVLSQGALAKSASIKIKLQPPNPGANATYKITLSGNAPKGHLGKKGNKAEIDIVEQLGGSCSSTPQAELAKSGIQDLGPLFVKKGHFSFSQNRTATSSSGTTIRFCAYLSTKIHKLVASATKAYTT